MIRGTSLDSSKLKSKLVHPLSARDSLPFFSFILCRGIASVRLADKLWLKVLLADLL